MAETIWIDTWWAERLLEIKTQRLEREAEDPGVPMWYPHPGAYAPVSFYAAAVQKKIPSVFNLDRLHREVLAIYGVTPA